MKTTYIDNTHIYFNILRFLPEKPGYASIIYVLSCHSDRFYRKKEMKYVSLIACQHKFSRC